MIATKRNNRLETYRGDTGILNVNVAGYEFVEDDLSTLEKTQSRIELYFNVPSLNYKTR